MPFLSTDRAPKHDPPNRWERHMPGVMTLGLSLLMSSAAYAGAEWWQGRTPNPLLPAVLGLGFLVAALIDEVRAIRREVVLFKYHVDYVLQDNDEGTSYATFAQMRRRLRAALDLPQGEWP